MSEYVQRIDRPYLDVPAKALPLVAIVPVAQPASDLPPIPMRHSDVQQVLDCVCSSYRVTAAELAGKDRHRHVMEARVVAYWLLRALTRASYPEIGIALAKDNTTVRAGALSCERRRAAELAFLAFTDELAAAVRARMVAST